MRTLSRFRLRSTKLYKVVIMSFDSKMSGASLPVSGIVIAVIASFINGSILVLQKKGIIRSRARGVSYFRDAVWWSGTVLMIVGQIGNFLAYNLAPVAIVTPLGALSIFFGAVLASWTLKEHLNVLGKLGCVLCCCGSVMLIIHAPKAETVTTRLELEERLLDPVFLIYVLLVVLLLIVLIVWIAPVHGTSNIMVYVAICSLLGTFTVPSIKGISLAAQDVFGRGSSSSRALALLLGFLGTLSVSVLIQFVFITKALERFNYNMFDAIYYVTFTCSVILASALFYKEWTALLPTDCLAMLCALMTVCVGVVLLRMSQEALLTWKKKGAWQKMD